MIAFAPVCLQHPQVARIHRGIDQQERGASHHGDAGEIEHSVTSTTSAGREQEPAGRLLPFGARKAGRQLAVARDHVADIGRAEERGVDRRGGREQRRDGDQPEAEFAQERLGRLGQRIVPGLLDLRSPTGCR